MKLILKKDNGLSRRSIGGKVFFDNKPVEVKEDFDYKKFSLFLEVYEEKEETPIEPTMIEMEEELIKDPVEEETLPILGIEEMTKAQLIENILENYEEYEEKELKKLKKDVLLMIIKGEFE